MKMQSADGWPASGAIVSFRLVWRSVLLQLPVLGPSFERATRIIYILYTRSSFFFSSSSCPVCCCCCVYFPPLKNITAHACPIADCSVRSSSHLWVLLLLFLLIWFFLQQRLLRTCPMGGFEVVFLFGFSLSLFTFLFSRLLLNCRETPVVISTVLFSMWNDLRSRRPFLWWRAPCQTSNTKLRREKLFCCCCCCWTIS